MIEFLQANWPMLALLAGLVVLFVIFRNRATRVGGTDQIWGQGEPVVVEIFSNT